MNEHTMILVSLCSNENEFNKRTRNEKRPHILTRMERFSVRRVRPTVLIDKVMRSIFFAAPLRYKFQFQQD